MLASWHFEWIRAMVVSWACVWLWHRLLPPLAPPPPLHPDAVCRCPLPPPPCPPPTSLSSSSVQRPPVLPSCRGVLLHSHLSTVCVSFRKHALHARLTNPTPQLQDHPPPPRPPHVCLLLMEVMGTNGASAGGRQASPQRCGAVTPQSDGCWIIVRRCVGSV